jgi:tetratricopeptide (TPR) repeat protein
MRRVILFSVVVCLGCLPSPSFSQATGARSHSGNEKSLTQALQLAKEHRYAEAAAVIHRVSPPADRVQRIGFLRLRASIESGLGHSAAAATDMEMAASLAPENLELKIASSLARLEAQLDAHGNPVPTLATLRSFNLAPPQQLELRLRIAEILSRSNHFQEAAKDLEEASRLAPDRADIQFDLALARYRNGEWDSALARVERAKALQDSGSVESLLGDIQEKRGDALAAVHSYQAAVNFEPNVEQHRLALATELLKHQTFEAAIVVLEQAERLFPQSVRVRVLLALTYYFVDRSQDSIRTLLEATRLDTADILATRYLGEITLQDSASPDPAAVTQVCTFADTHPVNETADSLCGGALLRVAEDSADTSRREEILRRLRHAVTIAPSDPLASCQLGKALEWSERYQQAKTQMEKCVRLDADSPENHYRLARIYRRLGLATLAAKQTTAQQQAVRQQTEETNRRTNTITRFLVLLNQ